ncbi:MAG: hypothetical protein IJ352_08300 [Muribaculaceae bacterium]|nr:hypothetical protein [Muribaculaceae bacterium]
MEFIRTNTPKHFKRNGQLMASSTSTTYISNGGGSGGNVITNYLPAYLDGDTFKVTDKVNFFNGDGMWEFFKVVEHTDESGTTTTTNESIIKISPDTITFGDGSQTLTTKHFYIDNNGNLHTPFNLVSDGEICAFVDGNGGNGGSGGGGTATNVVDNLISTSTTDALSANQGRILNEKITASNHQHDNKGVLDTITSTMVTNWNTAHSNSHTHGININSQVYNLIMGNYGGIKASDTDKHIMRLSDGNVTVNANGRHLYLGGDTTQITYLPTYFDNGDGTTIAQWNSFTANNLYLQMPLQIALQSHNQSQPPIKVNTTNLCTSLNADLLDGYHGTQLVNNVGVNGDNITVTKGTTTTNIKPNFATKAQRLVDENNSTYISTWNKTVQIQGLKDAIYLGSQAYKNNNYSIYFVTNNGTAESDGVVFWNYINGTNFTTQVPHRILLQSVNNTEAPIYTNSTNLCTNLNANYLQGKKASDFVEVTKNNQTITGNIKIVGNLEVQGTITASDDIMAYSSSTATPLTTKIKTALANVENATTLEEIKNILTTLKNTI